jgi:hypothetical protein
MYVLCTGGSPIFSKNSPESGGYFQGKGSFFQKKREKKSDDKQKQGISNTVCNTYIKFKNMIFNTLKPSNQI